jgi:hypothetical protein
LKVRRNWLATVSAAAERAARIELAGAHSRPMVSNIFGEAVERQLSGH